MPHLEAILAHLGAMFPTSGTHVGPAGAYVVPSCTHMELVSCFFTMTDSATPDGPTPRQSNVRAPFRALMGEWGWANVTR